MRSSLPAPRRCGQRRPAWDLFSLNNGAFVALQAASSPQLAAALGGRAFLEAAQAEAEARLRSVVGATWGAAASLLGDGATSGLVPSRLSAKERETVKDRFRAFNECFEAAAPALPKWAAPDAALRSRLKEELGDAVLRLYGELFAVFADSGFTKFRERYKKHHPEEAARVFDPSSRGCSEKLEMYFDILESRFLHRLVPSSPSESNSARVISFNPA